MPAPLERRMAVVTSTRVFAIRLPSSLCRPSHLPFVSFMSSDTTNNKDGDDSNVKEEEEEKQKSAKVKLNHLLDEFQDRKAKMANSSEINLAKPKLSTSQNTQQDVTGLKPEVVHAVHLTASLLAGQEHGRDDEDDDDHRQAQIVRTESDLLKKLKSVVEETEEAKSRSEIVSRPDDPSSLVSLIRSIKVDDDDIAQANKVRNSASLTFEQLAFLEERRQLRKQKRAKEALERYTPTDLFHSQSPLGIFDVEKFKGSTESSENVLLKTWKRCEEREMKILSTLPPRNLLEDMVTMTEKGLLWQFPINNEQGIDEATLEPFHKHVFLEHNLEPWCPKKGPIRHFMELVCAGLSKNPHISVQKKVDNILWYRDYFEKPEHKEILQVSGAYDD